MSKIYIEPFSGLSGDMFLSALCSLSDSYDDILNLPDKLNLPDAKIEIENVNKNGIYCKSVNVLDLNKTSGHTNDHGQHRHLSDIHKIIRNADLSENAKRIADDIFTLIGEAESKIHNIALDKIHFHELSGVDSIIDIVGNAILIDKLNIEEVYSRPICTGFGMVKTQHGLLPIPAPATAELLRGFPIYTGNEEGEKVTPTGAAILKYLNPKFVGDSFIVEKLSYGPGNLDFEYPNVLRISLIETETKPNDSYIKIELNIDDMSHEFLGIDFQAGLFEVGAKDFHITQTIMKKGRPGIVLSVILIESDFENMVNYLFENTSTIGLRYHKIDMKKLQRKFSTADTEYGQITIKESFTLNDERKVKYEYNDLSKIAQKTGGTAFKIKNKIESRTSANNINDEEKNK